MRQIEFRGKSLESGKWIYGNPVETSDGRAFMVFSAKWDDKLGLKTASIEVDPKTVGQYTGEKIHEAMVYKGDVLELDDGFDIWKAEVKFSRGAFIVDVKGKEYDYASIGWLNDDIEEINLIGNIHDNPELLK